MKEEDSWIMLGIACPCRPTKVLGENSLIEPSPSALVATSMWDSLTNIVVQVKDGQIRRLFVP